MATNWEGLAARFCKSANKERVDACAASLGVRSAPLKQLGVGWDGSKKAWTFAERDGGGKAIGLLRRDAAGSKKVAKGSRRGLYIPKGVKDLVGPVLLPEGASDTAAILSCSAAAVGRPSCDGGSDLLVELFKDDERELVVVGDNDKKGAGRTGAEKTAATLATGLGRLVSVAMPPAEHKDIREWLKDFREGEGRWPNPKELIEVLRQDQHTVEPGSEPAQANQQIILANYSYGQDREGNAKPQGLPLERVRDGLYEVTGGWPRRVGDTLFVGANGKPIFLESTAQLFGWIDDQCQVDWRKGSDCLSQERFYESLRMTAQEYEAIESLPHFPPLPNTFYLHPELPEPDGEALEHFLNFFNPETAEDRGQIMALVMTPFWGGPPGRGPATLVTAPEGDIEQGRGLGKSTLLTKVADLAGGFLEVQPHEDMPAIIKRLLSPEARSLRMAHLDNVKTLRLSWAELEGLITSPVISGHRMYKGEGRRPNTLMWGITLNGGSLSKDFAQRCRIIRVARPEYDPQWERRVNDFIAQHRWRIVADVKHALERPCEELTLIGRWPIWQKEVLAKVENPNACEELNRSRQAALDDDAQEQDLVRACFREQLRQKHFDPDHDAVFIPTAMLSEWVNEATGERRPVNKVTPHLRTLSMPELLLGKKRGGVPGWEWHGCEAPKKAKAVHINCGGHSPGGKYKARESA